MKIHGWSIDGFGVFGDTTVDQLSSGLTVFHGANEAGKSTLLAFLRGVFFGFPDGRSREPRYPPLKGGSHGGRVFVDGPSGVVTIEREAGRRRPARVIFPDNQEGGEEELTRLLGGADIHLFRSVFAFSLTELQSFASLNSEGVKERIFSAGIAGAGRSAAAVQKRLDERTTRLLKVRGRSATLIGLADELEDNRKKIREADHLVDRYPQLIAAEEKCSARIAAMDEELKVLRQSLVRHQSLIDLWPVWCEIAAAREELASLSSEGEFPADGEVRFERTLEKLKAAEVELDEVESELKVDLKDRDDLRASLDDQGHSVLEEATLLHGELGVHRERMNELPEARSRLESCESVWLQAVNEAGKEWDESELEDAARSLPQREEVRRWESRIEASRQSLELAQGGHVSQQRELERATVEVEALRAELPGDEPPARPILDDLSDAVRRLRVNLADLRAAETQAAAVDGAIKGHQRELSDLHAQDPGAIPVWVTFLALLLAVGSGAGVVVDAMRGDVSGAILFTIVAVVCAFVAVFVWRSRRRAMLSDEQTFERVQVVRGEVEEARRIAKEHEERLTQLGASIEADSALLEVEGVPDLHLVETKDAEVRRQLEARLVWEHHDGRIADAVGRLKRARHDEEQLAQLVQAEEEKSRGIVADWKQWKDGRGIPSDLTPQGALDFIDSVRVARDHLDDYKQARRRVQHLEREIDVWGSRAEDVLRSAGAGVELDVVERGGDERDGGEVDGGGEASIQRLVDLMHRLDEDQRARLQLASLDAEIERRRARREFTQRRLMRAREERDELLTAAGVADEEAFRVRHAEHTRRVELGGKVRDGERRVVAMIGQGPEADSMREELAGGNVDSWRNQIEELSRFLKERESERVEAIREHRDAEAARKHVESSADLESLQTQRAGLVSELERDVSRWRVLTLARALVARTLQEFEQTRQPQVLSEASRIFRTVTDNRYEKVFQSKEGDDVMVIQADGVRKGTGDLSRGTAEQLYLSLRLGLIAEYARRSVSLPLVMDDVLVNFDPERARGTAAALADFARHHQVLLFTCHPSTAEMISEVAPTAEVRVIGEQETKKKRKKKHAARK